MHVQKKLPQLYGAIILIFPGRRLPPSVFELLPEGFKHDEYPEFIEVVYRELDNIHSWEIDDLLTQLFANCNLDLLYNFLGNNDVRVLIDISFHHYSKFPALVFEGQNMQIIHKLQADVSIDPY